MTRMKCINVHQTRVERELFGSNHQKSGGVGLVERKGSFTLNVIQKKSVVELDEVWGLFNEVVRQGGCMLVDMYVYGYGGSRYLLYRYTTVWSQSG